MHAWRTVNRGTDERALDNCAAGERCFAACESGHSYSVTERIDAVGNDVGELESG